MSAEPGRLGSVLAALARGWGMEDPLETARLFAGWEQVVGSCVAARCRPTSLRGGVLKVRTESAIWASEFRYLAPEVIKKINAAAGKSLVKEVKPWVRPAGFEAAPQPKQAKHPKREANRARAQPEAKQAADQIPDAALARAFERAAEAARMRQEQDPA